ncbi:transketolase family protein [Pseudotabrizicola alkalilacus]|uniref:Transketolase family protein n=1 Tax=Pseudotabrizicola alkalilacus TaxID=2305252 RepID=A0A411YZR2_9RHOB|nr:transketolase C-terminal domain-containing protein [Pseudotabrizicola alkalilacus]RGP36313.1 transketolase family protein [Pseudotabrizicola alkalilacus]
MAAPTQTAAGLSDCRTAWAKALAELARADDRIVAVVNDSVGSSKLDAFAKEFPDRLINVGIAEQVMVGVSAGLANGGKVPFVSAASCFLTGRALEQVKADIAYANFNVKLIGQSSGVAYGELGATHHSIEDFAWLRPMTNLIVIAPADPWETAEAVKWAAGHDGPVYLRLSRMPVPDLVVEDRVFRPGKAELLQQGSDVTLIGAGTTSHIALAAAQVLAAQGVSARVLNMATINPLDDVAVLAAAEETRAIVTVEEASVRGGLGGAVAELITANRPVPLERVGFPGFVVTGSADWLFAEYGLTADNIAARALAALERAKR